MHHVKVSNCEEDEMPFEDRVSSHHCPDETRAGAHRVHQSTPPPTNADLRRLPGADLVDFIGLQRAAGNAAVGQIAGKSSHAYASVQRQAVPVIPAAGLALAAAGFAASNRPAGTDTFGNTNVSFRYSRDQPGPRAVQETRTTVFELDSVRSFGDSAAKIALVLRHDGQNIVSGFTEQERVTGYDGGTFGSEAAVNFSAVQQSQPTDPVTGAYIIIQGFNNPSGPGSQRFRARLLVTGEGKIEPMECKLTEGDGFVRTAPWCFVGFSDLHKGYSQVEPDPLPPDLSGAGIPGGDPQPPHVGL